ncbi:hypothetical protein J32TS6_12410 [Virgibacillus pantothenticus]|uniref:hypothetical protein n=1 Tax=Virgibacillus pantothenticus TaxID=1473 RepID=UPI001B014338|nr:hypothetical protein [Virgibacillus pantothenticus]GIP62686.1 hypothetical protein J32TS6_12410 [Virgibacillus pantothenticus]
MNENKVTVIDAMMGKGKSSYAIQMMNDAPLYQKFIYITPFLSEVERVLSSVKNRKFIQPEASKGKRKKDDLKDLISKGSDIVSTHSLFQKVDDELIELLNAQGYTLILDEVMNVIEQERISRDDLKLLLTAPTASGEPTLTVKEDGFCQWNDESYKEGKFINIKRLAESNNLMIYEDKAVYWTMPVEAFKAFDEVYILTYLFDGQIQRYYYDLFNVQYSYKSVDKVGDRYELTEYLPLHQEDRSQLKELINIYYPTKTDKTDLNKIGDKRGAFSVTHLNKVTKDADSALIRKMIKDNAYNFYRNKCKASSADVMWTTFKDAEKTLAPKNLKKQFVEVTSRATNDYADKTTCIYLANRFLNPITAQFFNSKGVKVNEELFALSELLQWTFRSRIRKGEAVEVYIPSSRMRGLLEDYLNNEM